MESDNSPLSKVARSCIGFLGAVAIIFFIGYTFVTFWRPETLMSENKVLSDAFTKAYNGPAFDVLRSQCWSRSDYGGGDYDQWKISYQQKTASVNLDYRPGQNPCLSDAEDRPAFVIKNNNLQKPGYMVLTTGEETKSEFSPTLVEKLLSAVDTGNKEIQRKEQISASWSGAQEGESNDQ